MNVSKRPVGKCKLCQSTTLLCHSHIVPEFCYTRLYQCRKLTQVKLDLGKKVQPKTIQKGIREYLLCENCEQILCQYEKHFKEYWYDKGALPPRMDMKYKGIHIGGANFGMLKLFHLSVLWRTGVSSICEQVKLGRYERDIAEMLLCGDCGGAECFPVIGYVLVGDDGTVNHGLVSAPMRIRHEQSTAYVMCYGGCEWIFIVTDHPTPTQMALAGAITASGDVFLLYMPWLKCITSQKLLRRMRMDRHHA